MGVALWGLSLAAAERVALLDTTTPWFNVPSAVVDFIDVSDAGQILLHESAVEGETVVGFGGRELPLPPHIAKWTRQPRRGQLVVFPWLPPTVASELRARRRSDFERRQAALERALVARRREQPGDDRAARQLALARRYWREHSDDVGPVVDCLGYHDGFSWRIALDTDLDRDFRDERFVSDFRLERELIHLSDELGGGRVAVHFGPAANWVSLFRLPGRKELDSGGDAFSNQEVICIRASRPADKSPAYGRSLWRAITEAAANGCTEVRWHGASVASDDDSASALGRGGWLHAAAATRSFGMLPRRFLRIESGLPEATKRAPRQLTWLASERALSFDLRAPRGESGGAVLRTHRRVIQPTGSQIAPLRTAPHAGVAIRCLRYSYRAATTKSGEFQLRWPQQRLPDGREALSVAWRVEDDLGRVIATGAGNRGRVALPLGENAIHLEVCGYDLPRQPAADSRPLYLERAIGALKLDVRRSATGQRAVIAAPTQSDWPENWAAGDQLIGHYFRGSSSPKGPGGSYLALRLVLDTPHPRTAAPAPQAPVLPEHLESIPSLRARLLRLDEVAVRKKHLEEIVSLCDRVVRALRPEEVRRFFATNRRRQPAHDSVEVMLWRKERLIETLYRRGRALGYMELPDVVAVKPIADPAAHHRRFEDNFRQLGSWVDTTSPGYHLLHIRRERRRGEPARALRVLLDRMQDMPRTYWHYKKRHDILGELGWQHLVELDESWPLRAPRGP